MTAKERKKLLYELAEIYLSAKNDNNVWQRENSTDCTFAKGKLLGACMALEVDFTETTDSLIFKSGINGKIIMDIEKDDSCLACRYFASYGECTKKGGCNK